MNHDRFGIRLSDLIETEARKMLCLDPGPTSATTGAPLSKDKLLHDIEQMRELFPDRQLRETVVMAPEYFASLKRGLSNSYIPDELSPYEPTLFGMRVIVSAHARVPAKQHTQKPWARGRCYHRRIAKKWIKRYGYKPGAFIFSEPMG